MSQQETQATLQGVLDAKKAEFAAKAPQELKTIYAEGIAAVEASGIVDHAKNMGDSAPHFTLANATGKNVSLADYLAKGPVVLTWYRGGWCPYCNLTLASLQQALPQIKEAGAALLALTPELPDRSLSTKEKHQLSFEVLSDVGNRVARSYGIVFKLTDAVVASYQERFDLHSYNGDDTNELPLPATYIVDRSGSIRYAFLDADYRNRAEPEEIISVLRGL